jgi:hypothetical protein
VKRSGFGNEESLEIDWEKHPLSRSLASLADFRRGLGRRAGDCHTVAFVTSPSPQSKPCPARSRGVTVYVARRSKNRNWRSLTS